MDEKRAQVCLGLLNIINNNILHVIFSHDHKTVKSEWKPCTLKPWKLMINCCYWHRWCRSSSSSSSSSPLSSVLSMLVQWLLHSKTLLPATSLHLGFPLVAMRCTMSVNGKPIIKLPASRDETPGYSKPDPFENKNHRFVYFFCWCVWKKL